MKLLDKPIKFSLMGKKHCFTVMGLLTKAAKALEFMMDKILTMVKAVLKPIIKLIDSGLKKIVSFIKLPNIPLFKGLAAKQKSIVDLMKSVGALDNPINQYMTCAFNLPFVMESGQNLCNCCFLGWITSNKVDPLWTWDDVSNAKLLVKKQMTCNSYGFKVCNLIEADKKEGAMDILLKPSCPASLITGELTMVGRKMAKYQQCVPSKTKAKSGMLAVLMYLFKGFLCRFQSIGLNPKVIMQMSPLPEIDLFRRRRGVGAGAAKKRDLCKCYTKSEFGKESASAGQKQKWKDWGCLEKKSSVDCSGSKCTSSTSEKPADDEKADNEAAEAKKNETSSVPAEANGYGTR